MRSGLLVGMLLAAACGSNDSAPDAPPPACSEDWVCTPWEAPAGSDFASRTCTDKTAAGTTECKPET